MPRIRHGLGFLFGIGLVALMVWALILHQTIRSLLLYDSGYDPQYRDLAVGLASKVLCVRDAIERRKRRVNFLRGDEPYKHQLGGVDSPVTRLVLTRQPAADA